MTYRDNPSLINQNSIEDFQFIGEDFSDKVFVNVSFISGSFHYCNLDGVTFKKCSFGGVNFSNCSLEATAFDACDCGFSLDDSSSILWPSKIAYT